MKKGNKYTYDDIEDFAASYNFDIDNTVKNLEQTSIGEVFIILRSNGLIVSLMLCEVKKGKGDSKDQCIYLCVHADDLPLSNVAMPRVFEVSLTRTGYSQLTISVYAYNEVEAKEKALEVAGDQSYNEYASEYEAEVNP